MQTQAAKQETHRLPGLWLHLTLQGAPREVWTWRTAAFRGLSPPTDRQENPTLHRQAWGTGLRKDKHLCAFKESRQAAAS